MDWLACVQNGLLVLIRLVFDTDSTRRIRRIEENSDDFGIAEDVQVLMVTILEEWMNEAMRCILALALRGDVSLPAGETIDCIEILKIDDFCVAHVSDNVHKLLLGLAAETAIADVDRTVVPMSVLVDFGFILVEGFQFLAEWQHIFRIPAVRLP